MMETLPKKTQKLVRSETIDPVDQAFRLSSAFKHFIKEGECGDLPSFQRGTLTKDLLKTLSEDAAIVGNPNDQIPGCAPYFRKDKDNDAAEIEKIFK